MKMDLMDLKSIKIYVGKDKSVKGCGGVKDSVIVDYMYKELCELGGLMVEPAESGMSYKKVCRVWKKPRAGWITIKVNKDVREYLENDAPEWIVNDIMDTVHGFNKR